jgi:hypothetical protein
MRTTISIDEDLYRRLKASAAKQGRTVSDLIGDALRDALRARRVPARELPPLPTFGGSGVIAGVDLSDLRSVVDAMDEGVGADALR